MSKAAVVGPRGMDARKAEALGLVHYPDSEPGITRRRHGTGFSYRAPDGTRIGDRKQRERLDALAIPPAYECVWISPFENGHLLATGRDDRTRKQYRYHPDWAAHRAAAKYDRLVDLGRGLPRLRRWVRRHLATPGFSEDQALACALALIDRLSLRVGAPRYTAQNGSFAATTLLGRHVTTASGRPTLRYVAKGGTEVIKTLPGKHLAARLTERAEDANAPLLRWESAGGREHRLTSARLAERLSELVEADVTPRLMRTWNGTHAAFCVARTTATPTIKAMAEAASTQLHNTPTIARSSYIHPDVIDLAKGQNAAPADRAGRAALLRSGEDGLVQLLAG